ncbi:unnamed protein product [Pseudo-nitzschia multistriata]|uniref:histidine kinase n=1 Tax=Pseudo-nitzschia multistriata TaxID=183589 RepID=A0A448YUB9_9STRA|nr:unnamed protein product [Pseudo-nitzschia multistriata]
MKSPKYNPTYGTDNDGPSPKFLERGGRSSSVKVEESKEDGRDTMLDSVATRNNQIDSASTSTKANNDSSNRQQKPFYGDLVRAVAFTAIVPVSAYDVEKTMACQDNESDPGHCGRALFTVFLCLMVCILNWMSYTKHSNKISFLAYLFALWVCAYLNLNQWPYAGECIITNMYQGTLFGNLCNGSLTFRNHIVRMVIMFAVGTYVSIMSPFSTFKEDIILGLGGPMVLAIVFLSATKLDRTALFEHVNWNALSVLGARWVLAAIYMYHVTCEMLSMTFDGVGAQDMFRTLVKASFVACVGVASTGAFQNEIDLNEELEVKVKNRTRIIQEKSDKLHMVELALRASETAIAITDSDLRIIWLNAACEEITSPVVGRIAKNQEDKMERPSASLQDRTSLLGKPIIEVLALDTIMDEKKLANAFSKNRREDEICMNGMIYGLEVSPYNYYLSPTMESSSNNHTNDSSRFLVVLKNITAERAREIAEKTAQEEAMLAKAMADSMVTLTHELRTPMQGIMGVTGMLLHQKQNADAVTVESLKLIMASSGLLLNLINNLLDVKKVNSDMMDEFPLSSVVAASAIQDTIDFCQPLASISGVAVVTDYGETKSQGYHVVSNPLRLQQVLINLVSNAIKYTSEESEILISIQPTVMSDVELKMENALACSRENLNNKIDIKEPLASNTPVLCFSISDSGPGIAPHQADRLFRRFARLDSKPTRVLGGSNKVGQPSGTGLGLNLCQLFVQRMDGEIWATNNSTGNGATFSFFLPLAASSSIETKVMAPISVTKQFHQFERTSIRTTQLRVLMVDDVLINRKVIGRMVNQVGVADIVSVDSGENALREISENGPFDLVITDLQMPGISGTELCETIMLGKTCPTGRVPVVVGLTADTSVRVATDCKASGMSTVLYKPISVIEVEEFFETTIIQLRPGVWYGGQGNSTILSPQ